MAYSTSRARQRLENQLDEIKRKLLLAEAGAVTIDLRDYAIAAGIFLAHAEIENYFVDLISGVATLYSLELQNACGLPSKLRAHLVHKKLGLDQFAARKFSAAAEEDNLNSIEKWFIAPAHVYLGGALPLSAITGDDIVGSNSYPSKANIEKVLRRIGIGDPRGALNRQGARDVVGLLESVGSLRTQLAHSATLPGIGVMDVVSRIDGLKVFCHAFDKVLYAHLTSAVPEPSWAARMC